MTFNVDMVKQRLPDADMDSLDILFKPENAGRLADCGISLLVSPTNILFIAIRYLGRKTDMATEIDYQAAADLFKPIRKYIKTFGNSAVCPSQEMMSRLCIPKALTETKLRALTRIWQTVKSG